MKKHLPYPEGNLESSYIEKIYTKITTVKNKM